MQDDYLDLDIEQKSGATQQTQIESADTPKHRPRYGPGAPDINGAAESEEAPGAGKRGDIRMFLFGFGVMILLGLGWTFLKPAFEGVDGTASSYWNSVKESVSDITNKNWFKDRTLYFTADADGLRLATDEEVTEHKQWREDMQNAIQDYEDEMRMYDDE